MTPWMLTEISQIVVTLIVLVGGGFMLLHGKLDADTTGMIKGLMLSWSGFWLGAKVQRNLPPTSTSTKVGPAESTTTVGN